MAAAGSGPEPADRPTQPLRQDLRLEPVGEGADGAPAWVIQDPLLNRFYRIGWLEFECLLRWGGASPRQICSRLAAETALRPALEQVLALARFLDAHQLCRPDAQGMARLAARAAAQAGRSEWLSAQWWLHHYLFFRLPLLRPQVWLQGLAARLDWLFSRWTAAAVAGLSLLGLLLVLQQWDQFSAAVADSFSLEGLLSFALALMVAKTLHELGHALVATRLGLKVAHMGVAFVVLWPMLYTDTGESWRLRRPRQRLAIAAAGIVAELALAGLATLGWALGEPGPWRHALLYLATTSWLLTLALNASPFMRFDGYFILSDLLDFPNLHQRAGALAQVALRRRVLGLAEPWPEPFAAARRRALIAFAFATWVYRLALFLGIALAVYHLFFKALGILLFAVEIAWFIVLPVWRELKVWWARRGQVRAARRRGLALLMGGLLLLALLPWRSQVEAVGVARAERQLRLFTPFAALLREVHGPGEVKAGTTLVALEQPDIAQQVQGAEAGIRGYERRLAGLVAEPTGLAEEAATRQRLQAEIESAQAARSELARLQLRAPFDGRWLDVDPQQQPGQWVGRRQPLGVLVDASRWQVDAYVQPDEVHRLSVGAAARFYAEGRISPLKGRVLALGSTRISQLEHPMLAQRHGGPLATAAPGSVTGSGGGGAAATAALSPNPALVHVLVQLDEAPPSLHETRGRLQIEGARRSLLGEGATRAMAVLLRESGF